MGSIIRSSNRFRSQSKKARSSARSRKMIVISSARASNRGNKLNLSTAIRKQREICKLIE